MIEINIQDKIYPENLRKIKKPPIKIYVEGNEKILNENGIAIIGSRNCTEYGKRMAIRFSKELTEYSINIISGLAIGIDYFAHKSCIENGGKTIAVLPCGLNNVYPRENIKIYNEIIRSGGVVVSEYAPNEKADSKKFLERNRIVSGLAIGTLVVEAGYRSGTSVTAKITKEQGKNVFVIPSSIENPKGVGTNHLIQSGAKLVTCVTDIISEYPDTKFTKKEKVEYGSINVEEELKDVYEALESEPMYIEQIAKKINLSVNVVSSKLLLLEINGNIMQFPGKRFARRRSE